MRDKANHQSNLGPIKSYVFHTKTNFFFRLIKINSKKILKVGCTLCLICLCHFSGKVLVKSSPWSRFIWDAFKQDCNWDKNHHLLIENIWLFVKMCSAHSLVLAFMKFVWRSYFHLHAITSDNVLMFC